MPDVSFSGLVIVSAVGFAAPFLLGLFPRLRFPAVVVEIVLGIVLGPSVLGWVHADLVIQVLSVVGLGFLLFVSGLEVELGRLQGPRLRLPVLKDSGNAGSDFGQLVIAGRTVADFGAVILLTLFFSGESNGLATKLLLLGTFFLLVLVAGGSLAGLGRSMRISSELMQLEDTTAQIRVRGAVLVLMAFLALAARFGLETILGAFLAGVMLGAVDRGATMNHPHFRLKLEGIAFGFVVPIFFVASGIQFDAKAVFGKPSTLVLVPIFLAALLIVRGVPAVLYRPLVGDRKAAAAALLQGTSLPFIVATTMIGRSLGLISAATSGALIAAGLLSVLIFPLAALTVLRRAEAGGPPAPQTEDIDPALSGRRRSES